MANYCGRFAPTPSGPLHFGSMVAAVGSYLDAKSRGGLWVLRIDDVDAPRVAAGATDAILRCLAQFQMHWDAVPVLQSERTAAYRAALDDLRTRGLVYPCGCSRKEIGEGAAGALVYPGTCRNGLGREREVRAWRVRTEGTAIAFQDQLQGRVEQNIEAEIGDFVLYRADAVFAYHLACVIDDCAQGVTHIVRGADLLASTPRQIYLQELLGLPTPEYLHLPVALSAAGEKLSKQTLAHPVQAEQAEAVLIEVLRFLNHAPPEHLHRSNLAGIWRWALQHWRRERLPAVAGLPVDAR